MIRTVPSCPVKFGVQFEEQGAGLDGKGAIIGEGAELDDGGKGIGLCAGGFGALGLVVVEEEGGGDGGDHFKNLYLVLLFGELSHLFFNEGDELLLELKRKLEVVVELKAVMGPADEDRLREEFKDGGC